MKLTKEIRIALVAIVGILVMYFGINFLKGINLFSTNNTYYMTFDDIQGMGASTPIYADGYKVGTVDQLDFDYSGKGPIKVKVDIVKDLRIPAGSTAEIAKDIRAISRLVSCLPTILVSVSNRAASSLVR